MEFSRRANPTEVAMQNVFVRIAVLQVHRFTPLLSLNQ
jgi:hypothetical protein